MTTFESPVKTIPASQEAIFNKLSDLNNLESVKDRIPQDKISDFEYDRDSVRFSVSPVGKIGLRIIEREPSKTIKIESEDAPMKFNLWVQIVSLGENESKIKLTVKADIPIFIKPMVSKPLQEALDKMVEMLAVLPYNG